MIRILQIDKIRLIVLWLFRDSRTRDHATEAFMSYQLSTPQFLNTNLLAHNPVENLKELTEGIKNIQGIKEVFIN